MPVGPQIKVYQISEEEARSIEKQDRVIQRMGYTAAALGTLTCAIGGIIHYFGEQEAAKIANGITELGMYGIVIGLAAKLTSLSNRVTHSRREPFNEGTLEGRIDKTLKRIDDEIDLDQPI